MTVRFLIDTQLPPALARHLISLRHEAAHVAELDMAAARDRDIWDRAAADGSILVAKEEDFVTMRVFRSAGPRCLDSYRQRDEADVAR